MSSFLLLTYGNVATILLGGIVAIVFAHETLLLHHWIRKDDE